MADLARAVISAIAHGRVCGRGSQKYFAREAGLSSQARLSRIERGECSPSLDELLGIAAALEVPASELLRRAEDEAAGRSPTMVVDAGRLAGLKAAVERAAAYVRPIPAGQGDAGDLLAAARMQAQLANAQLALLEAHGAAVTLVFGG